MMTPRGLVMVDKFERYHSALSWFAKNREIFRSTRNEGLEIIFRKICTELDLTRVGIWLSLEDGSGIKELMTYRLGKPPSFDQVYLRKDYPIYFKAFDLQQTQVIENALTDTRFSEYLENYVKAFEISALLDVPIFSDGLMIGIISYEASGSSREWDIHDINFAGSCADFIARFIEAERRFLYENDLKHRIDYLENDLQKKIEDLKAAKTSLELALEGAQGAKWDWDVPTNNLILNPTWYTRLGYVYNEFPQNMEGYKKTVHPDDLSRVMKALEDHLSGKTVFYECRYRMITKTGGFQWVIDRGTVTKRAPNGDPLRVTGVNINITPIIQLEETLLASEQQLKSMIQSLPTAVAMLDKDFQYIAYSSKWEEEWGSIDSKIHVGTSVKRSDKFKELWYEKMQEGLSGKTLSADEDLIDIAEDLQLWIRWVVQPWKTASGEIGGVVVMAENITHRKESEMRINQSSKLSALGEMAGGIAHEINNPLSIIKGYIDLLKRHSSRHSLSEELLLQYIDKMDLTVGRISRIVSGMRRFSRESSMDEKIDYSLNSVIDETLDICLERITNNGTAVNVEHFQEEALIHCRPVEISQVLLNLINNAFQAIALFPHPWILIKCETVNDVHRISVTDSGGGIPGFVRQKLFQPFFTTKDIGVGPGLGLSISRGIIEEHHGRLYYQEEATHTTFVIELPSYSNLTEDLGA
jgi:signal transduction histidine kinase